MTAPNQYPQCKGCGVTFFKTRKCQRYCSNRCQVWSRIATGHPDDCWPWTGSVGGPGYGQVNLRGQVTTVHRWVCRQIHGDPPPKADAMHSCDNRRCCNPHHISWGSRLENVLDAWQKGRMKVAPRAVGEDCVHAKISEKTARSIIADLECSIPRVEVAARHNASRDIVRDIDRQKTWKHLR